MPRFKKQNVSLEPENWQQFMSLCKQLDTTASREVRRFVREFLRSHKQTSIEDIAKKSAK